jgi:hypothetical protein
MPKPRPSVLKRQREQNKRDRKAAKAEMRAQRKTDDGSPESEFGDAHQQFEAPDDEQQDPATHL